MEVNEASSRQVCTMFYTTTGNMFPIFMVLHFRWGGGERKVELEGVTREYDLHSPSLHNIVSQATVLWKQDAIPHLPTFPFSCCHVSGLFCIDSQFHPFLLQDRGFTSSSNIIKTGKKKNNLRQWTLEQVNIITPNTHPLHPGNFKCNIACNDTAAVELHCVSTFTIAAQILNRKVQE